MPRSFFNILWLMKIPVKMEGVFLNGRPLNGRPLRDNLEGQNDFMLAFYSILLFQKEFCQVLNQTILPLVCM